jgi:hypothetical protein
VAGVVAVVVVAGAEGVTGTAVVAGVVATGVASGTLGVTGAAVVAGVVAAGVAAEARSVDAAAWGAAALGSVNAVVGDSAADCGCCGVSAVGVVVSGAATCISEAVIDADAADLSQRRSSMYRRIEPSIVKSAPITNPVEPPPRAAVTAMSASPTPVATTARIPAKRR